MLTAKEKYNTIMPQTNEKILCVQIDKVISEEGYKQNFIPKVEKMLKTQGEIRILIYYKEFKGWEKNAAMMDLQTSAEYADKIKKLALVNAPDKEIFQKKLKQEIMGGNIGFFSEEDIEQAIKWVSN